MKYVGVSDELLTFQYFVLEDGVEVPRVQKIQKVPNAKAGGRKMQLLLSAEKNIFSLISKALNALHYGLSNAN